MSITDIIKEAFVFPLKDLGPLAIYIVLTLVISFFSLGGLAYAVITDDIIKKILGILIFIIAILLEFVLMGYQIRIIKSGLDSEDSAPAFDWKEDCVTGIKYLVVKIVYYIIPAIITFAVGIITNVPGNISAILNELTESLSTSTGATNPMSAFTMNATNATDYMTTFSALNSTNGTNAMPVIHVSDALIANLATSLAITAVVAIIVFLIFSILQFIAEARLANTGSIGNALNMIEVFKDIGKIGYGKVIGTFLLIAIIIAVINMIFGIISGYILAIWILSIIISPYLIFFSKRATGLLYSEIA